MRPRPQVVDGLFLLGHTDARRNEERIPGIYHHTLADVLDQPKFHGKVADSTEDDDVGAAMRRCGMARKGAK